MVTKKLFPLQVSGQSVTDVQAYFSWTATTIYILYMLAIA